MPSLFSRSRTTSPINKQLSLTAPNYDQNLLDEFGRVTSRSSNRGNAHNPGTPNKKDKKKDRDKEKVRTRTLSSPRDPKNHDSESNHPPIPDGSFLPLNLERPRDDSGVERPRQSDYGYLSYERHVVLGLEQVARLVDVVVTELSTRGGLTTPFIFSTLALDISASAIKRLIQTFLGTCADPASADAERRWRDEARFAGPHELGMCLRWGIARVVRSVGGEDVRGLIAWEHYLHFRDSEAALQYPPAHFATFLPSLVPPLRSILLTMLSFLTRLTAYSASSGHTPPTLSPLFGPLFFGLGPATLAFHHTYIHYLRATNAMEHLLLAFIRWQDTPRPTLSNSDINTNVAYGSATSLGVPARLKDWIRGYPSKLPFLQERDKKEKPQARRGARTIRVIGVRRNVRMYSPDLVKTAASWAQHPRPGAPGNDRGLMGSKEWDRISPATLRLPARYSDPYKHRMNLPTNFHPDVGASAMTSMSSSTSSGTSSTLVDDKDYFGLGGGTAVRDERFKSLTDLKWGEFEAMGFGSIEAEKKLQFDLTEGARVARSAKRATLSWNDFSAAGFTRTDAPLHDTLQFTTPLANSISTWTSHNAELAKKLKKTQRDLPPFGWDTDPVMGSEEMIEEAFLDVFCDLVYGGGWLDLERGEELDRECNWALVEFKSLPISRTTASGGSDPRTATSLLLFEEFVPLEYRQQLAEGVTSRRRLPSLFSASNKSKQWKPAATLNGRPYVVGHVPHSPSYLEVEFEGLLHGTTATKAISVGAKNLGRSSVSASSLMRPITSPSTTAESAFFKPSPLSMRTEPPVTKSPSSDDPHSDSTMSPSLTKRHSRFRLPGGIPVPSPGAGRKSGMMPAEYSTVEFETRLASYSDDEYDSHGSGKGKEREAEKQARRESKDDAWVDILVGTQSRRLESQESDLKRPGGARGLRSGRSDPALASLEVAHALALVRERSPPSDDELNSRHVEPVHFMEPVHNIDPIDEIQIIPRRQSDPDIFHHDTQSEHSQEQDEGEDEHPVLSLRQVQKQQRRLGYFDLHPERRPISLKPEDDEDPRSRLSNADSDDDEDDEDIYGPMDDSNAAPSVPPKSAHYAPKDPEPFSPIDVPQFDVHEADWEDGRLKTDSLLLPRTPTDSEGANDGGSGGNASSPRPHTQSKTAALIEMYRERERALPAMPAATPATALTTVYIPPAVQPSRLPVRALPPPPKEDLPVVPTASTSATPSPEVAPLDPPRVALEESGRASPMRYVHGAPLHNVLEEEEEHEI